MHHAGLETGVAHAIRYPTKIKRAMIFVLGHQVKAKVAKNCGKSAGKPMIINRNLAI
jgi:hypothetical protein